MTPTKEKKQLLEALSFNHLIETIFDSVILLDLEGNIVYANEAAYLIRGYSREELLQMKISDLEIPELRGSSFQRLKQGTTGRVASFESIHGHKDGRRLYIEARSSLFEIDGNQHYLVVLRDITERVQAERQIRETQELLNSILANAPVALFSATADGTYRLVNPAWEKLTGKPKNKVIGRSYEELFSAKTAKAFKEVSHKVVATGSPLVFDETALIKGEQKYFHTVIFPIKEDDGLVTAIGGISLDITQKVRSEKALRERKLILRTLIDSNPESFFLMDTEGTILAANRVMAQRLGKNPEEIIGTSIYDHTPAEIIQRRQIFLEQAIETGRPVRFEDTRGNFQFELYVNPVHDLTGKVSQLAVLGVDITERKRTEEALRESEESYRIITEGSPAGVFLLQQDGALSYVNRQMASIFGYTPEEIVGRLRPLDLVHPDDRPRIARDLQERLDGVSDHDTNSFKGLRKDGSMIYCELFTRDFEYQGRKTFLGTMMDVTERELARQALLVSEAKYRELVETANSIILRVDTQGNITFFNEFAQKFFGYPEEEIINKNALGTIVQEVDSTGFDLAGLLQDLYKHPERYCSSENENVTREGKKVWVAWTNKGIYDQEGNLVEILCVGIDRTRQKQLEKALRQLNRDLEQRVLERTTSLNAIKSRMEQIIATTPVVILTASFDTALSVSFVSDHVKYLGYEPGEILGTKLFDFARTHPEDRGKVERALKTLFADHQMVVKYRIRKQDGGFAWIQANAKLVINESGMPVEIVASWTDITRQTQLEQKLEILSGPAGKLSVWKQGGEVLEDLVPFLMPQSWERVQECLQAAFRGGTTSGVHLRLQRRDGTFLHGVLTAGPLQLGIGGIYEAVGVVIELSHEKQELH